MKTRLHRLGLGSLAVLALLSYAQSARAADKPYIAVGNAKARKVVLAIAPVRADPNTSAEATTVRDTMAADLTFMDVFRFLSPTSFIEQPSA
ncbi:MAG: hypothetical protein KGQ59_09010, partial [Bdellovibrionales bacterium]|nr:hypothetical protein [Bdellovibrionales bacterium]